MSRHHPMEVRLVVAIRLAPVERELIERAFLLKYHRGGPRSHKPSLSQFIRDAACMIAHQVVQAAPPPEADARQVDIEDLIAMRRRGPLRWKVAPGGVAHAPSPLEDGAEFVVKPERRKDRRELWRVELHTESKKKNGPALIEVIDTKATRAQAIVAAEAAVRVALRTKGARP